MNMIGLHSYLQTNPILDLNHIIPKEECGIGWTSRELKDYHGKHNCHTRIRLRISITPDMDKIHNAVQFRQLLKVEWANLPQDLILSMNYRYRPVINQSEGHTLYHY